MDADDKPQHQSSSLIKQSNPKLIIKFAGRNIIHQQQCSSSSSSKDAEEMIKNMSVSKHNLLSISNSSPDSSLSPTCSICGKSFTSKQSLFGHMRSHPDREWKGIQPPPIPSSSDQSLSVRLVMIKKYSSPASTDSDDSRKSVESYQGVGPLPIKWAATGKRGRRPYGTFLSSSDERIVDAIKGLLMLKEGNDLDVAYMNKQISRETEGISMKKRKKMILESSSEDVSRSSEVLRSSKKIKIDQIDQERSCGSSRDGFVPKLQISNIQSRQLEQLPAGSNMFQEDGGLVMKSNSKKVKLDERISCGSSRDGFDPKLMNNSIPSSHLEQLPLRFQGDFSLVENSSKKLKLDDERGCSTSKKFKPVDERGCSSSDRGMFDPKPINSIQSNHLKPTSPMEWMYSNGFHRDGDVSKLLSNISRVEQVPPNGGYFQGGFNSVFLKPAILMKSTANKKKVKEIERGSADQNMGMQVSCSNNEFKCDTCNRTFPSHQALGGHKSSQRNCKNNNGSYPFPTHDDHQYQYLQCRELLFQPAEQEPITETKTPATSYVGSHRCELCGATFGTGQALGGHKRRHYTGGLSTSGTVPVELTGMAQTIKKDETVPVNSSAAMVQTDQLTARAQIEKLVKKEELNKLPVVTVASSVGEEVVSAATTTTTTTTTTKKTENKPPVWDFDLNELPDDMPDDDKPDE